MILTQTARTSSSTGSLFVISFIVVFVFFLYLIKNKNYDAKLIRVKSKFEDDLGSRIYENLPTTKFEKLTQTTIDANQNISTFSIFSLFNTTENVTKMLLTEPITKSDYQTIHVGKQTNRTMNTNITIVTTLFHFNKSKHSDSDYDKWSETMIKSLASPFVAFVDNYWADTFIKRCNQYNLTGTLDDFFH